MGKSNPKEGNICNPAGVMEGSLFIVSYLESPTLGLMNDEVIPGDIVPRENDGG